MLRVQARHFDMISDLPDSVIDYILVKLPTIDAVRTSVLSRKWRHAWTRLTQFSLNEYLLKSLVVKDSVRSTVTMMLLQLMLNHEGPVLKFTLSMPYLGSCPVIDNLIIFLSRNNIEDFTLKTWKDFYSVPASIFKCQHLRRLTLQCCRISNVPSLMGFSRLTALWLFDIVISDEALRSLISNSPLLKLLDINVQCSDLDIYIDAPNLRIFSFDGYAKSISLQLMPLLASVTITMEDVVESSKECSLNQFFRNLPVIEDLQLDHCTVETFVINEPKLSTTLVHLQYVYLDLVRLDEIEVQFILCLLRSSPNMKSLEIQLSSSDLCSSEAVTYMRGEDYSDIWLTQLEDVALGKVTGSETDLEFIKLLLAKSPSLKKIVITPGDGAELSDLDEARANLKEVIKFERASKEARVILE